MHHQNSALPFLHTWLAPRVALVYALFGVSWILFSDALVAWLIEDSGLLIWAQMLKGWFFVAITALALWLGITKALRERELLVRALMQKERGLESMLYAGAHDLRTPLINIRGFAAEMREELKLWNSQGAKNDSPHLQEALLCAQRVDEGVQSMADLLDAMLRLHRLARGKARPQLIDPCLLLEHEVQNLSSLTVPTLQLELSNEIPVCWVDPDDLREIIRQLVRNAILHNSETLRLLRVNGFKSGGYIRYEFEDNGPGIDAEIGDRIFEPFFRVGKERTGVGIGLTLARQAAERNGGNLHLERIQGKHCRFVLELPQKD